MTCTTRRSLRRTRTFSGCITCRSRHIKCDQSKPVCSTCISDGLSCDYDKQIYFDADSPADTIRYRQMLFSDSQRTSMNNQMLSIVPLSRAPIVLCQIDDFCAGSQVGADKCELFEGPFGVFRLNSEARVLNSPLLSPSEESIDEHTNRNVHEDIGILNDGLEPAVDSGLSPHDASLNEVDSANDQALWRLSFEFAPCLLKHYSDVVIPSFTPKLSRSKTDKTPWHVLFLPLVKISLANITIGQPTTSADLAVCFATLACSAADMYGQSHDSDWLSRADVFTVAAYNNLGMMLKDSLVVPKRYKYKSVLMAILSLVQLSAITGSWESTDTLLIEAETFIRLRGLTKTAKSRKVRMLHHCYAHARILQESISLTSSRSLLQFEMVNSLQESGLIIVGSDPPLFCITNWHDLDEQFLQPKSQEAGENDLHLARPGSWPPSLYAEIFEVNEDWLSLLSQTIRLANEKELAEVTDTTTLSLKEFTSRAKMLERYILSRGRSHRVSGGSQSFTCSNGTLHDILNNALLVYFYRRVYDLDAEMLEQRVLCVKDGLEQYVEASTSHRVPDVLAWSAFVTGCEALSPQDRTFFSEWFCNHANASSHTSHGRMIGLMKSVWRARQIDAESSSSWTKFLEPG